MTPTEGAASPRAASPGEAGSVAQELDVIESALRDVRARVGRGRPATERTPLLGLAILGLIVVVASTLSWWKLGFDNRVTSAWTSPIASITGAAAVLSMVAALVLALRGWRRFSCVSQISTVFAAVWIVASSLPPAASRSSSGLVLREVLIGGGQSTAIFGLALYSLAIHSLSNNDFNIVFRAIAPLAGSTAINSTSSENR